MGGEAGKGDDYRPVLISAPEWSRLWDIAFPPKSTEPNRLVIEHNDPGDENDCKQK